MKRQKFWPKLYENTTARGPFIILITSNLANFVASNVAFSDNVLPLIFFNSNVIIIYIIDIIYTLIHK